MGVEAGQELIREHELKVEYEAAAETGAKQRAHLAETRQRHNTKRQAEAARNGEPARRAAADMLTRNPRLTPKKFGQESEQDSGFRRGPSERYLKKMDDAG